MKFCTLVLFLRKIKRVSVSSQNIGWYLPGVLHCLTGRLNSLAPTCRQFQPTADFVAVGLRLHRLGLFLFSRVLRMTFSRRVDISFCAKDKVATIQQKCQRHARCSCMAGSLNANCRSRIWAAAILPLTTESLLVFFGSTDWQMSAVAFLTRPRITTQSSLFGFPKNAASLQLAGTSSHDPCSPWPTTLSLTSELEAQNQPTDVNSWRYT